jgi:hypothetical protein
MRVTQIVVVRQRYGRQRDCLTLRIHPARGDVHTGQEVWVAAKEIVGCAIFLKDYDHVLNAVVVIWWSLGVRGGCTD